MKNCLVACVNFLKKLKNKLLGVSKNDIMISFEIEYLNTLNKIIECTLDNKEDILLNKNNIMYNAQINFIKKYLGDDYVYLASSNDKKIFIDYIYYYHYNDYISNINKIYYFELKNTLM